jgi:hypothetical protein
MNTTGQKDIRYQKLPCTITVTITTMAIKQSLQSKPFTLSHSPPKLLFQFRFTLIPPKHKHVETSARNREPLFLFTASFSLASRSITATDDA